MISDALRSLAARAARYNLWVHPIPADTVLGVFAGDVRVGEMPAGEFADLRRRVRRDWGTLPSQAGYKVKRVILTTVSIFSQALHTMVFGGLAGIVLLAIFGAPQTLRELLTETGPVTVGEVAEGIRQYFLLCVLCTIGVRLFWLGSLSDRRDASPWNRLLCSVLQARFEVKVPDTSVWRIGAHNIVLR